MNVVRYLSEWCRSHSYHFQHFEVFTVISGRDTLELVMDTTHTYKHIKGKYLHTCMSDRLSEGGPYQLLSPPRSLGVD